MHRKHQPGLILALCIFVAGCSASTGSTTTLAGATTSPTKFSNLLVIGVAHDYDGRARFERRLVAQLGTRGTSATAYYVAVKGNKPITREAIEELVKSQNFDGVIITKVVNRDTDAQVKSGGAATKTVRKDDGALKLFRYDYQELNEPATLNINVSITILSELYETRNGDNVWALETQISKKEMVSEVVDDAVAKILRRLQKDRLID